LIARQYKRVIEDYARANPDLDIFLATSVFHVGPAKTQIPILAWGDTTVQGVMGLYPYYSNITEKMIEQSHAVEQVGLSACTSIIFSSDWAAQTALNAYEVDASKVHVITYGANVVETPDIEAFEQLLRARLAQPAVVTLVGVDWKRKGVDKAISAVGVLRQRGMQVRLRVVGCKAPASVTVPDYVDVLGKIPKVTSGGQESFYDQLKTSHVVVLPSVAECAAVSLIEANAYGLPVVASNVGGNPSLVRKGRNGDLCDPTASAELWADALEGILKDPQTYERLSRESFALYHGEYSWDMAISRFERLVETVISSSANELTR
jgi:glycosyltransferase involved in cell wall biosynthesis